MTGTPESQTSSAHLQVQRLPTWPGPISLGSTPGFPYSLCQDSLGLPDPTSGLLCGPLLHSTPHLQGCRNSGVPRQGISKGLEVQWGWFKVWGYECRIYLEKEATTDGDLPSQLLLCPIFPGLCFHSISLCLGRVRDVNHGRLSVR